MLRKTSYNRKTLPAHLADFNTWPKFDTTCLSVDDLLTWERRRGAVCSYLSGDTIAHIERVYEYKYNEVARFLNRCVQRMDDGAIAGWIGLVKNIRLVPGERKKPVRAMVYLSRGGYAGALTNLFSKHPDIEHALNSYLVTGVSPEGKQEGRVTKRAAHQAFLRLCFSAGIGQNEWPFCVERQGRSSLGTYFDTFRKRNHHQIVTLQYGDACKRRSKRGIAVAGRPVAVAPFEIIESDEHEVHVIVAVGLDTPKGVKYVPCQRMTVILAVDRFTNYILGWLLVLRRVASSSDFLECMDRAIEGQCLSLEIVAAMRKCLGNEALTSGNVRVGFNSVFIDNALSHLSDDVCERLRTEAGASVSFGAIQQPKRRSLVEHIFSWLGCEVSHKSPSTTGNSPMDTRRNNPEKKAVDNRISFNTIVQAIESAVAVWNSKPTEANYGGSPESQMLEYYLSSDGCIPPITPMRPSNRPPLRVEVASPTVRGSQAKGRGPSISYAWVEYTSEVFATRWDLLGKRIRIHADPYDVSVVQAYSEEGSYLGELVPLSSRWRFAHSLQMRQLLKTRIKYGHDSLTSDPVGDELRRQQSTALAANQKSPRATSAASIIAEEERKGYVTSPLTQTPATNNATSTQQLVKKIRKQRDIDFSIIGRT